MKNTKRMFRSIHRVSLLLSISLAIFLTGNAQGQIVADFVAGVTDEQVDGFFGMPGLGWKTAWTRTRPSNTEMSSSVLNSNPLTAEGGNYLSTTVSSTRLNPIITGVRREYESYGSVSLEAKHTISFIYRLDAGLSALNRIIFYNGPFGNDPTEGTQWAVRGQGGGSNYWAFYNGTSLVNSNMTIYEGDAYAFEITINPVEFTYSVFLQNLDYAKNERPGEVDRYRGTFDFYSTSEGPISGQLSFLQRMNDYPGSGDPRFMEYSIGNISIVPEPGILSAVFGSCALLMASMIKRQRNQLLEPSSKNDATSC